MSGVEMEGVGDRRFHLATPAESHTTVHQANRVIPTNPATPATSATVSPKSIKLTKSHQAKRVTEPPANEQPQPTSKLIILTFSNHQRLRTSAKIQGKGSTPATPQS